MHYQNKHDAPAASLMICASIYSVIAVVFDDFALLASFVIFFYGGVLLLEFAALFIMAAVPILYPLVSKYRRTHRADAILEDHS